MFPSTSAQGRSFKKLIARACCSGYTCHSFRRSAAASASCVLRGREARGWCCCLSRCAPWRERSALVSPGCGRTQLTPTRTLWTEHAAPCVGLDRGRQSIGSGARCSTQLLATRRGHDESRRWVELLFARPRLVPLALRLAVLSAPAVV